MNSNLDAKIGFALGGLGGFNAHGVGFLQAAKNKNVTPAMITCTSGMIYWTAKYLEGENLEKLLMEQIDSDNRFPPPFEWANTMWLACMGNPGIFRPAIREYWARWINPMTEFSPDQLFDRLLPAQLYVPLRTTEEFGKIADILNSSSHNVAIMFNTFSPEKGKCYLHINKAAQALLGDVQIGKPGSEDKYLPITAEAVRGALWLYLYGFETGRETGGLIDGAYNRQFIISEMHPCKRIYIVRPQNVKWLGHLPRNYFEVEDFKIETWFNSSYMAEIAGMELINKLLKSHPALKAEKKAAPYHPIELVPIEVEHNYGYFEYFVEHKKVYQESLQKAMELVTQTAAESRGIAQRKT